MTTGNIYFNVGTRCLIRLCVSVSTLRKVYKGPVVLLAQGDLPRWAIKLLRHLSIDIITIDPKEGVSSRTMKASLWRYSPFDVSLFIDSDTVIMRDPSVLFDTIKQNRFIVTEFSNWVTTGRRMGWRIRTWAKVLDDKTIKNALHFGLAINTGVFGWCKNADILSVWEKTAREGWKNHCTNILRKS